MYACDTGEVPAVCVGQLKHYENVHTEDVGMISQLIGFFKKIAGGNGNLLLRIVRGKIEEFESTSKIPNKKRSA